MVKGDEYSELSYVDVVDERTWGWRVKYTNHTWHFNLEKACQYPIKVA